MSLWWVKKGQLDSDQVRLIEDIPLDGNNLVIGPPGSGKTNILLRRAQFLRLQSRPNVLVLTFTRALTEFLKTGCHAPDGRELFPPALINTVEAWQRSLHKAHQKALPTVGGNPEDRRAVLAASTMEILQNTNFPRYDALFVDEAQDLVDEEVALVNAASKYLFFVGDDRQKIYQGSTGLSAVRAIKPQPIEHALPFHYRLAREICEMADRIQVPSGVASLVATQHYQGPTPGRISVEGPIDRKAQIANAISRLRDQTRVYGDFLRDGDRLGIIVPRRDDREEVFAALEASRELRGASQIVRARNGDRDDDHDTTLDPERPILILTAQGAKGLEFRAVQWLFSDDLENYYTPELYYTVVTRAKTSLDIYYTQKMPEQIAKAYSKPQSSIWD